MEEPGAVPQTIGFGDVLRFLRRRRLLILITILLGTGLTMSVANLIPPRYSADATLVFERSDTRLLQAAADFESEQLDFGAIETEMDVLRTRLFAGKVVGALGLADDPEFGVRPPDPGPVAMVRGLLNRLLSPILGESGSVADQETEVEAASREPPAAVSPVPVPVEDPAVVIKQEISTAERDRAITVFLRNLTVLRTGNSLAVSIRVTDEQAARAALHANAIGRVYIDWSLDIKRRAADTFFEFFRTRAARLEQRIADLESEIASFSAEHRLVSNRQDDMLRNQISQLVVELSKARAERSAAQARLDRVVSLDEDGGAESVVISQLLGALRGDLAALVRKEADLSASFGPRHPDVQAVNAEIESTQGMIASEVQRIIMELRNEVEVGSARIDGFVSELGDLDSELRSRAMAEIRLREMQTNLVFEQRRYDEVLNSLGNLDQQAQVLTPSARLLSEAAVPSKPSFPNMPVIAVGSALGSMLVAIMLALVWDGFDTRIRSDAAVRRILGVPTLAFVPSLRARMFRKLPSAHGAVANGLDPAFAEAMREVYRETGRIGVGTPVQTIMTASSLRAEGNVDLALGLVATATLNNHKSILVGLDFQCLSLPKKLGLGAKHVTLDRYLFGDATLSECITRSRAMPKVDLALVSTGPDRKTESLEPKKIEALIAGLRERYDYVVIDGPPLLISSDFDVIAGSVDAVILSVRWGKTHQETLRDVANHFRDRPTPLIGTAIMNVEMRRHAAGGYGGRPYYQRLASRRAVL